MRNVLVIVRVTALGALRSMLVFRRPAGSGMTSFFNPQIRMR